ncbi:LysR family transcriptional regulator [Actinophytocola algeriensis]|uniref:DNA-binding transcriptional LysR family regulator n=1 Tax=Actinophytocola algeriensis TaxID=1768010 RepID=A0A7W7Q6P6_9PSEU|nr:LysR family transcriptional regulator [Actinophytocola algeriensis]MBB4907838.1 DNA-binding transcriptional LysR family regulator [Actinophytocola algeriensis]MBE1479868.1 DNA-binding transcriptional LysR family regulator [Actinophytocola algeriensis]
MDSRELRYFVAVAEELNFGRAATRLGIAQPPLSRTIQQLERRMGVTLFERTSRQVSLTTAGEVLLHEGRRALTALTAAERRTQRAGTRLVLTMKPHSDGGLLEKILTEYAASPSAVEVDVHICGIGEQGKLLREGEADAALLRFPHDDTEGFAYEELLTEPDAAVLPRTHRLADRESLTMADLAGEQLPHWPGNPPNGGPLVRDSGQLQQLIALGRTIALLPASTRHHLGPELAQVPVTDAPTSTLAIAWAEDSRSRPLAAFIQAAVQCAPR